MDPHTLVGHSKREDSIVKKNERLISEIAVIKFKYNEIIKENEKLKTLILKRPTNYSLKEHSVSSSLKYRNSSAKNKSLPKNNSTTTYINCNTLSSSAINSASKARNPIQNINKHNSNFIINNLKKSFSIDHKQKEINTNVKKRNIPNNNNTKPVNMLTVSNTSNLSSLDNTTNNNINTVKPSTNTNNSNLSINNSFTNTTLANLVISFLSQMKALQESISNHSENIKEMKKKFELKKKELKKYSENVLGVSSAPSNFVTSNNNSLNVTPRAASNPKKPLQQNPAPPNNAVSQLQQLQGVVEKLNEEIAQLKGEIVKKDEKIKNEKTIGKLCEEKLNEEKKQNKTLNELNQTIKNELNDLKELSQTQKESIDSLQKINSSYLESDNKLKENLDQITKNLQSKIVDNENLNKTIENLTKIIEENKKKNQELETENIKLKTEIDKLKLSISECNNNIITISNTNENIIKEKDKIILNLTNNISDLNKQIENLTNNTKSINQNDENNKQTEKIKQENTELKNKITLVNKENRELKNKIAEIKTEYVSHHDEEIENLRKNLIDINDKASINLLQLKEKNKTFQNVKEDFNSKLSRTSDQFGSTNEAMRELKNSTNEYVNAIELIKSSAKEIDALNQKISLVLTNTGSPDKVYEELINENQKLKDENNKMRNTISQYQNKIVLLSSNRSGNNNGNNPNKTLSNINEQNSNFIDDELSSVSGIFIEEKTKENTEVIPDSVESKKNIIETAVNEKNQAMKTSSSQPSLNNHTIVNTENSKTETLERKNSQSSLANSEGHYQSNLKILEDNELLLKNQLDLIKNELKKTREERDECKKQLEGKKDNCLEKVEMLTILKQTFEKLVDSIQLVGKVKDYVIMIFKIMNYTEDDIKRALSKKEKKKNLFGNLI